MLNNQSISTDDTHDEDLSIMLEDAPFPVYEDGREMVVSHVSVNEALKSPKLYIKHMNSRD